MTGAIVYAAAGGLGGCGAASCSTASSIDRDEAAAVGQLAHGDGRDDDLAVGGRVDGTQPTATGATPVPARSSCSIAASASRRRVDRRPGGDAATGEADAVADEQEPVVAGDVVEVERGGRVVGDARDGRRVTRRSPGRRPVSSWVIPPLSSVVGGVGEPGLPQHASISAGAGR